MAYYVVNDDDCRVEGMTYEQILNAIQQALEQGYVSEPDEAVISKIKEINAGDSTQIWIGTESEYNALNPAPTVANISLRLSRDGTIYLCKDDSTITELEEKLEAVEELFDSLGDLAFIEGALPIANGGTGATDAATARTRLGIPSISYGTADPSGGNDGDVYIKYNA